MPCLTSHKMRATRYFTREAALKLAAKVKEAKPENSDLVFTPVQDHTSNLWRVFVESRFGEHKGWCQS